MSILKPRIPELQALSDRKPQARNKRASTQWTPRLSEKASTSRVHTDQSQSEMNSSRNHQELQQQQQHYQQQLSSSAQKKRSSTLRSNNGESADGRALPTPSSSIKTRKTITSHSAAKSNASSTTVEQSLEDQIIIAQGSFGIVFKARLLTTKEEVAVKRVYQNNQHKNREQQIMMELNHLNIVPLKYSFYSFGDQGQAYLNLVMEYVPSTLLRMIRYYHRKKPKISGIIIPPITEAAKNPQTNSSELFPDILIKLYMYQALSALAYLNEKNIAHRDLKPANILVDHVTHAVKLCDFGSAKKLNRSESNLSYICSRNYRAPELILGAAYYTTAIDTWSLACTTAEMLLGEPLFKGESSIDQLIEIMKVLGTPSPEQISKMNPEHRITRYPPVNKIPLARVFKKVGIAQQLLELLEKMLVYEPNQRITPAEAMKSPYFNELRIEQCRINGKKLPPLIKTDYALNRQMQSVMFPKV